MKRENVISIANLSLRYGETVALDGINLSIPSGSMVGLIGPDGVGKSSLLSLIAGARMIQTGTVEVLGGDMGDKSARDEICPRIAYMPQGLGRNLYPTLSVEENLQFFGLLFGHNRAERRERIDHLTQSTGLYPFLDRPAGKLSGGMKQKLGLCCALIHDPDLLILDEPTTGVDPLARAQFWDLIDRIRLERPEMSVIVATAYMDEAEGFQWLIAMDDGKILAEGTPQSLLTQTKSANLEEAFIHLLPEEKRQGYQPVVVPPLNLSGDEEIAIAAEGLTKRFGDFTAVNDVNFTIRRGEIFGFLGSNGCGKSTTMKMLTGLLPATEGRAWLFGQEIDSQDINTRRRVGYMSQAFSLYGELTVLQNLILHARLFHVPEEMIAPRVEEVMERFSLNGVRNALPEQIPLGMRQRLSLAVAMVHKPELLILDEPTSGVDPVARDNFWRLLIDLSRNDQVTIFISTHFMNEALRCDRMSMMHAGEVLDSDTPENLIKKQGTETLEEAFIKYLIDAGADEGEGLDKEQSITITPTDTPPTTRKERIEAKLRDRAKARYQSGTFSVQRALSYTWREALELRRDPVRATLALIGSIILMLTMGYGISMDVENLTYAILDNDQTSLSRDYAHNISGSRYFIEQPPLQDHAEIDKRMQATDINLAIEIPPGFARDLKRGTPVEIGVWIDGAMPMRADTIRGYVQGMHQDWLMTQATQNLGVELPTLINIDSRFRYNPEIKSLPAIVPAVIPILLLLLPSMLAALSVVREKELGSIINLYVTPITKAEFILGKQLPYLFLAMINYFLMLLLAITLFDVPIKGSFITLTVATLLFCMISTGFGLLASTFTKSQIGAMFITIIVTLIPAIQFSGLINPVPSLEGMGRIIGDLFPATHMLIISRGVFGKALGFANLYPYITILAITAPIIIGSSIALLKKQEK